jgi:hypothetical protein
MDLKTIESKVDELKESKENNVSPYRACQIVNDLLGTRLPPQMFYTYVKKQYISTSIVDGHRVISRIELVRWFTKYTLKNHLDTV